MDTSNPWEVEEVRDRVGKRVAEFLHAQRPALDDISPDVGSLVDTISEFMDGGKRLRAMFLYWGWRASGGPDNDVIITGAASMEFLQACALIHDDVMDRSDRRRGRPAVHRQFSATHADAGWAGSPDDFGDAAAILVGDLCLSWADTLLMASDLDPAALRRGKPVYDAMRSELMAGQYLDVLEQARMSSQVESALRVATYKSAKYTIERPLHLGAALADGEPGVVGALRTYGLALGQAFQLRDDLLGVFGDSRTTGKPSGDDLREGKRTVLIALALADLPPGQRAALDAGLGDRDADDDEVAGLRAIIGGTDARRQVERMIHERAERARAALDSAPLPGLPHQVLSDLIGAATDRVA